MLKMDIYYDSDDGNEQVDPSVFVGVVMEDDGKISSKNMTEAERLILKQGACRDKDGNYEKVKKINGGPRKRKYENEGVDESFNMTKSKMINLFKSSLNEGGIDLRWIFNNIRTAEAAVQFFQANNIIPLELVCEESHNMIVTYRPQSNLVSWRCRQGACDKTLSIRQGTWLERSKLPLETIIAFVYCWTKSYTAVPFCQDELNMAEGTTLEYNSHLREVCAETIFNNPVKIGGPNLTVEIEEAFYKKRKRFRGKMEVPENCIFAGVCKETKDAFIHEVPSWSKESLTLCIKERIEVGSILLCTKWESYEGIEILDGYRFQSFNQNNSVNFLNPSAEVHTQSAEISIWFQIKKMNKRHNGINRGILDSHMCECLWRRKHEKNNLFEAILNDIAEFNIRM